MKNLRLPTTITIISFYNNDFYFHEFRNYTSFSTALFLFFFAFLILFILLSLMQAIASMNNETSVIESSSPQFQTRFWLWALQNQIKDCIIFDTINFILNTSQAMSTLI